MIVGTTPHVLVAPVTSKPLLPFAPPSPSIGVSVKLVMLSGVSPSFVKVIVKLPSSPLDNEAAENAFDTLSGERTVTFAVASADAGIPTLLVKPVDRLIRLVCALVE
ncbi:hypothetical protein D3C81_1998160 [compost metagenome]